MGDRGNICVLMPQEKSKSGAAEKVVQTLAEKDLRRGVFFYTHWSGSDLPKLVQKALVRGKGRRDDEGYFSRIVFSELLLDGSDPLDNLKGVTGYGISLGIADNEHDIMVVDIGAQKVYRVPEEAFVRMEVPEYQHAIAPAMLEACVAVWTFEEFSTLDLDKAGFYPPPDSADGIENPY